LRENHVARRRVVVRETEVGLVLEESEVESALEFAGPFRNQRWRRLLNARRESAESVVRRRGADTLRDRAERRRARERLRGEIRQRLLPRLSVRRAQLAERHARDR